MKDKIITFMFVSFILTFSILHLVIKDEKVSNINYVSSLNFRIAKQVLGASNKIIKYVINEEENSIYSTLIVSPPGVR